MFMHVPSETNDWCCISIIMWMTLQKIVPEQKIWTKDWDLQCEHSLRQWFLVYFPQSPPFLISKPSWAEPPLYPTIPHTPHLSHRCVRPLFLHGWSTLRLIKKKKSISQDFFLLRKELMPRELKWKTFISHILPKFRPIPLHLAK